MSLDDSTLILSPLFYSQLCRHADLLVKPAIDVLVGWPTPTPGPHRQLTARPVRPPTTGTHLPVPPTDKRFAAN
jgi:hypothetical protein